MLQIALCMQLPHLGINQTLERIKAVFYWQDMAGDVSRYCYSCDICQKTFSKGRINKAPLEKMLLIDMPFKRVAVDIVGPIFSKGRINKAPLEKMLLIDMPFKRVAVDIVGPIFSKGRINKAPLEKMLLIDMPFKRVAVDIVGPIFSKGRINKAPLEKMLLIGMPFKRVAVDIVGPIFSTSEEDHRYFLTLVDYAARYPEATPLKNNHTTTVAEALVDLEFQRSSSVT